MLLQNSHTGLVASAGFPKGTVEALLTKQAVLLAQFRSSIAQPPPSGIPLASSSLKRPSNPVHLDHAPPTRKPAIAVAREKVEVSKRVSLAQAAPTPSGEITPHVPHMRGRLRARYQFWSTLGISALVLSWVATGFPLQWKEGGGPPPQKFFTNHPSALEQGTFVTSAIADLIATHAAIELPSPAYVNLPLGVVPKH